MSHLREKGKMIINILCVCLWQWLLFSGGECSTETTIIADNVTFLLFTPHNPKIPTVMRINDSSSLGHFNTSLTTVIAVHGQHGNGRGLDAIPHGYLSKGSYNVIEMDWSGPANGAYNHVKHLIEPVGKVGAQFLDYLASQGLDLGRVHLEGASFGGQVVGIMGGNVKAGRVGRITGLDPARPWFDTLGPEHRLDDTDAQFVDVIHTCAGKVGWLTPLGHADFYPNSGNCSQPGCTAGDQRCSHVRALYYFEESITSEVGFRAKNCDSWADYESGSCAGNATVLMGDPTPMSTRGVFYLHTAGSKPYALGANSYEAE
ncbi:lipase member H-like [Bacillus rossius redtenbacheri]|uniref:lipase member H-like n=1 Tax=Bacillus rossius redtenbacheri TaxID=93214 RepID=UPI002FDD3C81